MLPVFLPGTSACPVLKAAEEKIHQLLDVRKPVPASTASAWSGMPVGIAGPFMAETGVRHG